MSHLILNTMKRSVITAIALLAAASTAFADNIRFASHPSLSPDGKQIYFSYDGDIYTVPFGGGPSS